MQLEQSCKGRWKTETHRAEVAAAPAAEEHLPEEGHPEEEPPEEEPPEEEPPGEEPLGKGLSLAWVQVPAPRRRAPELVPSGLRAPVLPLPARAQTQARAEQDWAQGQGPVRRGLQQHTRVTECTSGYQLSGIPLHLSTGQQHDLQQI